MVDESTAADVDGPRAIAEREVMLELQRAMLPGGLPVLPDVSIAAEYRPADLSRLAGGDWFDVVPMPDDQIGLVVGDVVGHGAMASAVMGQVRAVAAERLQRGSGLDEVMLALDAFAGGSPGARGGTVCLAVLDRRDGMVCYAVRGHPPPLVIAADGTTRYLSESTGPPLALPSRHYRLAMDSLLPGDTLVLYSDGAIERPGSSIAQGLADLAEAVSGVVNRNSSGERALPEAICATVSQGLLGQSPQDDISVLAARMLSTQPERLSLSVPATPDQLSSVRRRFSGWLSQLRPGEDDLLALELSLVEAVTNSIEHAFAGPPGTVRVDAVLDREGMVNLVVGDDGRWKPPKVDPGFRGRGLIMMREFSDRLRLDTSADGTTVRLGKALRRPVFTNGLQPAGDPRAEHTNIALDVQVEPEGVVVSVSGAVDSSSVETLHACLIDAERRGWLPLTIVLDKVTMLASAGLRTLYEHAGNLLAAQRSVRLVAAAGSPVRDVLRVSGLDELVEVLSRLPMMDAADPRPG